MFIKMIFKRALLSMRPFFLVAMHTQPRALDGMRHPWPMAHYDLTKGEDDTACHIIIGEGEVGLKGLERGMREVMGARDGGRV